MVIRFRRSSGVERQQLKWFAFAVVVLVTYFVMSAILEGLGISEGSVGEFVSGLAFLGLPVAVGIAILQYRLWDLDVVVKKTVVAGNAGRPGARRVRGCGRAGRRRSRSTRERPALLFAIALASGSRSGPRCAIGPPGRRSARLRQARDALRGADRVLRARRRSPTRPRTSFRGWRRSSARVPAAEVARVWLFVGGELRPAVRLAAGGAAAHRSAHPRAPSRSWCPERRRSRFATEGELLGALSVRMPASDPMSPSKEKLVRDLAAQAGMVLRNVRLVEDLRTSRQRLVAAQDEERRRLERNIHDGAQQQLVALAVKARLAGQFAERDPAKTAELLDADRGRDADGARGPARPRPRHLPAAARRPGLGRGDRGPVAEEPSRRRGGCRRPRTIPGRCRGDGLLLHPRGPAERREVRRRRSDGHPPRASEREPLLRGRGRRARLRSVSAPAPGPGSRGWPTGSPPWEALWRSARRPGREPRWRVTCR